MIISCGTCRNEVIPDKQNVGNIELAPIKDPIGLGLNKTCFGVETEDHPDPMVLLMVPKITPFVIISSCTPVKNELEYVLTSDTFQQHESVLDGIDWTEAETLLQTQLGMVIHFCITVSVQQSNGLSPSDIFCLCPVMVKQIVWPSVTPEVCVEKLHLFCPGTSEGTTENTLGLKLALAEFNSNEEKLKPASASDRIQKSRLYVPLGPQVTTSFITDKHFGFCEQL